MYTSSKPYFYGTGRRKKSVARVRIVPGTGAITINKRDIDDYFGLETLKLIVNQPFGVTGTEGKFDIIATVNGGGISGQAGAIRHGVARALVVADAENKPALKAAGFLTRDPRMKERKKYGLKEVQYATLMAKRPELAVELAVKGMLPKNSLGAKAFTRLKVYAGEAHIHEAQKPEVYEF